MTAVDSGVRQYQPLPPDRPARELEEALLARWDADGLFPQTLRAREGAPRYVFFEGPPTANGRPGIHHVFARTVKDLFCRYRAMRGYYVARKAGWDTHGLPVEIEVEKQLGISGKQQIEALGVAEFNRLCRESVWRYRGDWEKLSARIGYWLDYGDPYVTYTKEYVESVWWALKALYDRDRLYRGHKILPYCPRCETALSSHEVAQGYEDVSDPSVYIALDLVGAAGGPPQDENTATGTLTGDQSVASRIASPPGSSARRRILVWTTTPWTLVSNVALAVNPELEYLELRDPRAPDATLILAEARAKDVLGDDYRSRWQTVRRLRGEELVGARYRRPLDWLAFGPGEHEIVLGEDFVSAADGTGVVHMAPAFGADDYAAAQRHGLAFLQPVNSRGEFPPELPLVGGMFVKRADPILIDELRRRGALWKSATITHPYPHCWRCGTPLLYYARTSWFVRTTAFRDQMLARNARVDWHPPEVGSGRFGEWLTNNIDWAISRDRYWGTPLPVWVCDADAAHVDAVGSYAELAARVSEDLPDDFDPHKPFIDRYGWPCAREGCTGRMSRVSEVIDTWFDSGSMPFAQWHYPFENRERFEGEYPGDFIAEGVDQTRGWFYSLLAIATGLGDALPNNGVAEGSPDTSVTAAPYRAAVVNDLVLDADGQKMSKSRGNVVNPWDVIGRHGADAIRLFLVASSQVWVPRRFDEDAIRETAGRFLLTFKHTYNGIFAQYANFGWQPSPLDPPVGERSPLDQWVLSELSLVEHEVDALLERYEATAAARRVMEFLVDDVSNWYVRLSRPRFYDVDGSDNRAAFATLHEILVVGCRLLAPFAPFVTDWMHRELTGAPVHLAPFVRAEHHAVNHGLAAAMGAVRRLVTLGRAAREEAGIPVRQALPRVVCVVPSTTPAEFSLVLPLLAAELNVKKVELASSADSFVSLRARPNFRSLGRRFGKSTPIAAQAVESLSSEDLLAFERGGELGVSVGNETHLLDPGDLTIIRQAAGDLVVQESEGYFAAIEPVITPELRREGRAHEFKAKVQRLRKRAELAVSDRIELYVSGNEDLLSAVRAYRGWIAEEVLAREIVVGDELPARYHAAETMEIDGLVVHVALTKVD